MAERKKESEMQSERKVGVYVCRCGGNISDHVDVAQVCEEVRKVPGVVVAREDMFMCSDPGQDLIKNAIRDKGLNRIVVASCSPRMHEKTFRKAATYEGLNPFLVEIANVRESLATREQRRYERWQERNQELAAGWERLHEQLVAEQAVAEKMREVFDAEREFLMVRVAQLNDARNRLRTQLTEASSEAVALREELGAARARLEELEKQ